MAAEKPTRPQSEEHSIKARKHEMFEEEPRPGPSERKQPAKVYLRNTPALPLSTGVKATLWAAGVVVLLLLLAAVFTRGGSRKSPPKTSQLPPAGRAPCIKVGLTSG